MGRHRNNAAKWIVGLLITVVAVAASLDSTVSLPLPDSLIFWQASSALAQDENSREEQAESSGDEASGDDPDGPPPCPECPECPDPAKVALSGLKEKRERLDKEEDRLKQEKKALEQFKDELDERLTGLEALKKQIDEDLALMDKKKTDQELQEEAEFEATMNKLVKMYSGMKPKDAAVIINKMDLEVSRQIFSRMRETSSAQILGYVDSEKAAKISESIVYRR